MAVILIMEFGGEMAASVLIAHQHGCAQSALLTNRCLLFLLICFTVFHFVLLWRVGGGHLYVPPPTCLFQDQGGVSFPPSVSQASLPF